MTIETVQLDWRGMRCPEPILKTARQVRKLRDGHARHILIYADDDAFPMDIESWAKSSGVHLVGVTQREGFYEATLSLPERPSDAPAAPPQRITTRSALPHIEAPKSAALTAETSVNAPPAADELIDCRGMCCPEPILQLARRYRKIADGQELLILADDDAFPVDVRSWAKSSGAQLVELRAHDGIHHARIQRPGKAPHVAPTPPIKAEEFDLDEFFTHATTPQHHIAPAPQPETTAHIGPSLSLNGLSWDAAQARLASMSGPAWHGEHLLIERADSALQQQVVSWGVSQGHELIAFEPQRGTIMLRIGDAKQLTTADSTALVAVEQDTTRRATLLVIHNDFESLMAALMIATTAVSQNIETSIFFSFWGVNLLRADQPRLNEAKKPMTIIHRLFRMMMPRGPRRQPLSKMHFGGAGKAMMLASMRQQNVMDLETLMQSAIESGVRFTICTMSMSIMGIQKRDIMELGNLEFAGVASFVADSASSEINMVF